MIHVNKYLGESSFPLIELIYPEVYIASTINDFSMNSESIRPTSRILPVGSLFNGKAIVEFEGSLIYKPVNEDIGYLYDPYYALEVCLSKLLPKKKSQLSEDKILQNPAIMLDPKRKSIELLSFNLNGPLEEERRFIGELSDNKSPLLLNTSNCFA